MGSASCTSSVSVRGSRLRNEESAMTRLGQLGIGATTLALSALFIFSNTNGDITVSGDDVWMMTNSLPFNWNYFVHANRGYVVPFYRGIFKLCGRNTQHTHLFYFGVMALSALLLYLILAKLLGAAPAVIGSILYLGYVGRYEVVTWISAGGYAVCAVGLFLSVLIAMSPRLGPWVKGALIAAINWLCVLLYEILMVAAPLYPLLYWLYHKLRGEPVNRRALAATFLPLLMFVGHICVLYFATPKSDPLPWQRGSTRSGMTWAVAAAKVAPTLESGVSAGMGPEHVTLLAQQVDSFWKYVPANALETFAAVGVCIGVAVLLWLSPIVVLDKAVIAPLVFAGMYFAFLSPLVGFTTFPGFTPPRLLTLTGVGLAVLMAIAVSAALTQRRLAIRYGVPAMMLAIGGLEAAAMNSILYQYQTSWAYDSRIRTQLLASGIKPKPGDTIFISLPPQPMQDFWRVGFSNFEGGHIRTILNVDYGMDLENTPEPPLRYKCKIRTDGTPVREPAGEPGRHIFCFSLSKKDLRLARTDCQGPH